MVLIMTANQIFASPLPDDAVQTSRCTHAEIIPGLDCVQCRNCRRTWPHWHPDYKRLLNQEIKSAPEQKTVLEQITPVAPEQKTVLEQKKLGSVKSALTQIHWIEIYSPSKRKDYSYYRYMWMEGRKLRHVHIPGGNTKSAVARAHKEEVEKALACGWWSTEIEDLIDSWRHK